MLRRWAGSTSRGFVGCIDKPRYMRKYGTRPIDRYLPQAPHLVAFSFVIERFVTFLEQNRSTGRVIYEHRDPWRNAYLQWEYVRMHVSGTQYLRSSQFNRVLPCWIEFVPKDRGLVGLELADLIVGPTARKVADPDAEMIEWEGVKRTMWRGSNPSDQVRWVSRCSQAIWAGNFLPVLTGDQKQMGPTLQPGPKRRSLMLIYLQLP